MANLSKIQFENVEYKNCCEIIHPWTESCMTGSLCLGERVSRRAGLFFFGPIYLIQLWMKRDEITISFLKQYLKAYLRSCAFGWFYTMTFMQTHCLLRKLMGKYTFLSLAFIPGFISGLSIFIEHTSRKNIVITTYTNLTLQYVTQWLEVNKYIKLTHGFEMLVFMVLSGFLMYLLRKNHTKANSTTLLWFFIPKPVRKPEDIKYIQDSNRNEVPASTNICPHSGTCWKNIFKKFVKFFTFGLGIRLLRSISTLLNKTESPSIRILRSRKMYKLAFFLASYVAAYEAVSCLMNRCRGRDSELHSILAGFLAGSCYLLDRNFIFILNSITTILQILAMQGASSGLIPHSSLLGGLAFAFCNGVLYHSLMTRDKITPNFFTTLLRLGTGGLSDTLQRTTLKFLYEETLPKLNRHT